MNEALIGGGRQMVARGGAGRTAPRRGADGGGAPRDLDMEAHLRAIAVWQRIGGLLGLLGGGLLVFAGAAGGAPPGLLLLGALPVILVGGASLAVGQGLWLYHAWGRWTLVVLQAVGLLNALYGLVAGHKVGALLQLGWVGATLAVLLSARAAQICSAGYRQRVARTPNASVRWWASPFFWIPALVLGLVLAAVLGVSGLAVLSLGR